MFCELHDVRVLFSLTELCHVRVAWIREIWIEASSVRQTNSNYCNFVYYTGPVTLNCKTISLILKQTFSQYVARIIYNKVKLCLLQ